MSRLAYYRDVLGFDASEHVPFTTRYRIRCSQCQSAVIQNVPCHETGCPHTPRKCRECGSTVARDAVCCDE